MRNNNKLKEKIKSAEQSIADLKDPALRIKAFEVVLSHLLLQDREKIKPTRPSQLKKKKRLSAKARVSIPAEPRKSQLKFNEEQLKELKNFYDKFAPSGREMCIFILVNFLRLQIKQEKFHEGDVEYCYQQLLNLRTAARPPAMDMLKIKQTLSWLVAPSRRKQWLEVDGEGIYKVSPNGILKFNDLEDEIQSEKHEEKT